jgi:hypothetical protein
MPCPAPQFGSMFKASLRPLLLLTLLFSGSACQATSKLFQGDFAVDVQGKPDGLSHLYVILGPTSVLEAAENGEEGYSGLALQEPSGFAEFYEFKFEPDAALLKKWTITYGGGKGDSKRMIRMDDSAAGFGGQLHLDIDRKGFLAMEGKAIAFIGKYRDGAPWQGTLLSMAEFAAKDHAVITLSDSDLHIFLYD